MKSRAIPIVRMVAKLIDDIQLVAEDLPHWYRQAHLDGCLEQLEIFGEKVLTDDLVLYIDVGFC